MLQFMILGEVTLAMLLGGVIGFDREMAEKPAGLRTHMIVAGAAALLVSLGDILISRLSADQSLVQADPIRVLEAVITGVSFLGAGTILRRRGERQVEGLTTAASLLFAAGVGVSVALSQFWLAVGVTILDIIILSLLKQVSIRWLNGSDRSTKKDEDRGGNAKDDSNE
jgi:putative Mg2+ transporter-C (MgtC) family protein